MISSIEAPSKSGKRPDAVGRTAVGNETNSDSILPPSHSDSGPERLENEKRAQGATRSSPPIPAPATPVNLKKVR